MSGVVAGEFPQPPAAKPACRRGSRPIDERSGPAAHRASIIGGRWSPLPANHERGKRPESATGLLSLTPTTLQQVPGSSLDFLGQSIDVPRAAL